jgi:hypothetical protein
MAAQNSASGMAGPKLHHRLRLKMMLVIENQ